MEEKKVWAGEISRDTQTGVSDISWMFSICQNPFSVMMGDCQDGFGLLNV